MNLLMEEVSRKQESGISPQAFEAILLDDNVHDLLDGDGVQGFLERHIPEVLALRDFHAGFPNCIFPHIIDGPKGLWSGPWCHPWRKGIPSLSPYIGF